MNLEYHKRQFEAVAAIEESRMTIRRVMSELEIATSWLAAAGLKAQCREALNLLEKLEQRLDRKLVVTLIGPSGAGKSTLLSALAGVDDLSPSGVERPTTRDVAIYCREQADAVPFIEALGEESVRVLTAPTSGRLEHVLLIDTPDTDSERCPEHRPMVEKIISASDILLCVFNSENPKRLDNTDYLGPLVALFPNDSIYALLTHCDRRNESELRDTIRPDFLSHLRSAWKRESIEVFCVSARRHLQKPDWPEGAGPLHTFDEFDQIQSLIFGDLNRGSVVQDRRIQQANHLFDFVNEAVAKKARITSKEVGQIFDQIIQLRHDALNASIESMTKSKGEGLFAVEVMLYQRMAQLSWGPVGWLVAIWSKLLSWGSGALGVLRIGSPVMQAWGAMSSAIKHKQTNQAIEQATDSQWVEDALREYRTEMNRRWPDMARPLVEAGFDRGVLSTDSVSPDFQVLGSRLASAWVHSLTESIERTAQLLSHGLVQLVLNLPFIAVSGKVAYTCISSFLAGQILDADYFRHAFVTLFLVWVVPFILLQMLVKFCGGMRLLGRAMKNLLPQIGSVEEESQIEKELNAVVSLAQAVGRNL